MLSIIIPAHNEEETIGTTVLGVVTHVKTPHEVIVVADHCSDLTEAIMRALMAKFPQIRLVQNDTRKGSFSNAVITGFKEAKGDAIVPVMADNCDNATTIDRMWTAMQEQQADVVCGSRYMKGGQKKGGPILQNILSRAVCYSLRIFTGIPTWDCANSYKMYRRTFFETLAYDIPDAGTEYSMALLFRAYRAGGKITEVPTSWTGEKMPVSQEWKILKRFPGYMYWYNKAIKRKSKD
jgi:glycosyltransferase involved in cell wall biosynthesis